VASGRVEIDADRIRESDRPTMKASVARIYHRFKWYPKRTVEDALQRCG
jgi:hypothetical protein